jgi:hypothetical protein
LEETRDGVDAALVIHATVGSKVIFLTGSTDPETMARIQIDHPFAVLFNRLLKNPLTRRGRIGFDSSSDR